MLLSKWGVIVRERIFCYGQLHSLHLATIYYLSLTRFIESRLALSKLYLLIISPLHISSSKKRKKTQWGKVLCVEHWDGKWQIHYTTGDFLKFPLSSKTQVFSLVWVPLNLFSLINWFLRGRRLQNLNKICYGWDTTI